MLGLLILLGTAFLVLLAVLSAVVAWEVRHPPRRTAGYAVARGLPIDPGEADLDFTAWQLDLSDGATLPIWEVKGAAASGQDSLTVVFIHGWGQSRIDMLARRKPYVEMAGRIICYDLRGHGEATGGTSRVGWREEYDLAELLRRLGPRRVLLVGYSMGSVIAKQVHSLDGGEAIIVGIISYGPYLSTVVPVGNRLRALQHPAGVLAPLAMVWLWLSGVKDVDPLKAAAGITVPLLVIHGRNDVICPRDAAERLAKIAPRGRFALLPGGHSDVHEKAPQEHDVLVRGFVAELNSTRDT